MVVVDDDVIRVVVFVVMEQLAGSYSIGRMYGGESDYHDDDDGCCFWCWIVLYHEDDDRESLAPSTQIVATVTAVE